MAMSDVTRSFAAPSLKNSQFEAYVVNVDDPDKRQRVRFRVPVLHEGIPDAKLPFANQQMSGMANAGSGVGTVSVPDRYAKITVTFPQDDAHNPQYHASPTSDDVNKDNELLNEDYPNTMGFTDSYGNRFSTNKATGDYTIAHKSGAIIHIDGSGNVTIASAGDLNIGAKGNINMAAKGRMRLSASGDVSIDGSMVLLNGGNAADVAIPGKRSTPKIKDQSGRTDL